MTIVLELEPQEDAILAARALADGVDRETVLRRIIAGMSSSNSSIPGEIHRLSEKNQKAIGLLEALIEADQSMTDEERTSADADTEEFKQGINRWRAEEGRLAAYK